MKSYDELKEEIRQTEEVLAQLRAEIRRQEAEADTKPGRFAGVVEELRGQGYEI